MRLQCLSRSESGITDVRDRILAFHRWVTETVPYALVRKSLVFGFAAALLEDIPVIGLAFTVSNRIGAAMWAHGRLLCHCFSVQT